MSRHPPHRPSVTPRGNTSALEAPKQNAPRERIPHFTAYQVCPAKKKRIRPHAISKTVIDPAVRRPVESTAPTGRVRLSKANKIRSLRHMFAPGEDPFGEYVESEEFDDAPNVAPPPAAPLQNNVFTLTLSSMGTTEVPSHRGMVHSPLFGGYYAECLGIPSPPDRFLEVHRSYYFTEALPAESDSMSNIIRPPSILGNSGNSFSRGNPSSPLFGEEKRVRKKSVEVLLLANREKGGDVAYVAEHILAPNPYKCRAGSYESLVEVRDFNTNNHIVTMKHRHYQSFLYIAEKSVYSPRIMPLESVKPFSVRDMSLSFPTNTQDGQQNGKKRVIQVSKRESKAFLFGVMDYCGLENILVEGVNSP